MKVDNGDLAHLVIDGVFDGMAGFSRGRVAFLPNRAGRRPEDAVGGTLDGESVRLVIAREGKGPLYGAAVVRL